MKKTALLLSFFSSLSFANSIESLVSKSYENNLDLINIKKAIDVAHTNIDLAQQWKNPVLTLGVNDINFSEPLKRDLEPMQTQYIGISQEINPKNKINLKKAIAKKDKELIYLDFEDKKLKLKSFIYEISYEILIQEESLTLLDFYEKNLNKINKINTSLYKLGKVSQNDLIKTKLALSKLKIQKNKIRNKIDNLYLKLEELTYIKVDEINASLKVKKLVLNMNIDSHPKLQQQKEKSLKYVNISKLEKAEEKPNMKVNIAYFNRQKFDDYANISVNIPLNFYNTSSIKERKAKKQRLELQDKYNHEKQKFEKDIKALYNNLDVAYKNYKLINKELIPFRKLIQKNLENEYSFTDIKVQDLINNLNELLSLQQEALNEKQSYFSNYSKLIYYIKGLK